jgi:signal peptidase I
MKINFGNWDHWWNEWIKPILVAAVLAMLIRTFIVQPFKIPSSSMVPTFVPGDRIFVNKFTYGAKLPFTKIRLPYLEKPETGDIVVFTSPVERKKFLVKRFIASGGQTVEIKGGEVFVDGNVLKENILGRFHYYNTGEYGGEGLKIKVPEGNFYVLGDNSANSMDSRYWGFVPDDNLVGKAFVIHWPPRRIRLLSGA